MNNYQDHYPEPAIANVMEQMYTIISKKDNKEIAKTAAMQRANRKTLETARRMITFLRRKG